MKNEFQKEFIEISESFIKRNKKINTYSILNL